MDDRKHTVVPAPKGLYAVGLGTAKLIDDARTDPYDVALGKRHVMISLFYPIERSANQDATFIPYMPPTTTAYMDAGLAQYGIPKMFGSFELQVANEVASNTTEDVGKAPLVLLSPGLTFPRHQYSALAQNLASAGYAVATMDHTHETLIVEYSDGTHTVGKPLAHWDPRNRERHEQLLHTRVEDAAFVLTQLGDLNVVKQLVSGATSPFNVDRAVILGHSFGGATAISALMRDSRFVGAINMDGSQYGPLFDTDKPVLLFARSEPSPRNRSNNATWQLVWEHLKGWKKEVNLKECEHLTFCDTPLLMKLSGTEATPVVRKMMGTLDGERAFEVVTAYIRAFLNYALGGEEDELFEGPSEEYPEIVFG